MVTAREGRRPENVRKGNIRVGRIAGNKGASVLTTGAQSSDPMKSSIGLVAER